MLDNWVITSQLKSGEFPARLTARKQDSANVNFRVLLTLRALFLDCISLTSPPPLCKHFLVTSGLIQSHLTRHVLQRQRDMAKTQRSRDSRPRLQTIDF